MSKYRLQCRTPNGPITMMEIDTESRAIYIQADNREAALSAVMAIGEGLATVDEIFINGEDVSEKVHDARPFVPMEMVRTSAEDFNLPGHEEAICENGCHQEGAFPLKEEEGNPCTAEDAWNASNEVPLPEEEFPSDAEISIPDSGFVMPSELPCLADVLPKEALVPLGKASGKEWNGIFIGRSHIKGEPVDISSVREEGDGIVIEGTLVSFDSRELRDGKKLYIFRVADDTNGISCKKFSDGNDQSAILDSNLKQGQIVKIRGNVRLDSYTGRLTMNVSQMEKGEAKVIDHKDDAKEVRVELHLHTKMSLDGLIDAKKAIQTASQWGAPAIAITDHGVIQAFPKLQEYAAEFKQKIIYGMEGYMIENIPEDIDTDRQKYSHIIILAKNMTGLHNLYRLVTFSCLKYYKKRPLIPKALLQELHEGLIYGSACVMGEFYRAVLEEKTDDELVEIGKFYDYLEVQPLGNNDFLIRDDKYPKVTTIEDLQDHNKKIIEIADKIGIPCCATSDAHFLFKEDQINRDILLAKWVKPGKDDSHPPVFIRTTQEMLDEFSYLPPEKAYEIVVTNTRNIADSCEWIEPLAEEWKSYNPKIQGADHNLIEMCYANARAIYGETLPKIVEDRLTQELTPIIKHGYGVLYYIAHKLVKHSNDNGYLVGSRGSVGSSFVATMSGITEVNPLPPHYVCPNCHWTEFYTDGSVGGGFDLPDRACPECGTALRKNGHNIPFAVFLGFDGDKVPDIDLNFSSGDDQGDAHKYTEELFGRDNVFRAGTISGLQEKNAYGVAKKYAEVMGISCNDIYLEKIAAGVIGVKTNTGQHPAGIMVCPRDMDIHNFTPLQYSADKKYEKDEDGKRIPGTITTHFDYHSISGRMLKLDILGHDDPKVIRMLQLITGVDPLQIPFDDQKTVSIFSSTEALDYTPEKLGEIIGNKGNTVGSLGLPEYGTLFVRKMLEDTKPKNFSELVRISGFSHGTNVWVGNAQDLIKNGTVKLEEAISTRDDVMNYLMDHGVDPLISFKTMENVRKGKGLEKGGSHNEEKIRETDVPEWFIDSCKKISYLFPRAHAVAYVMMAFRIAWFKVNYPLAFYASYFTIRAEGKFNAAVNLKGLVAQKAELDRVNSMDNPTDVDKKNAVVTEVAAEMYMRGFEFLPISLEESSATDFVMKDGKLLPPFNCIPAMGNTVAKSLVTARAEGPFTSKEDLKKRAKVSATLVETMEKLGILKGLPEEEQMNLFGF